MYETLVTQKKRIDITEYEGFTKDIDIQKITVSRSFL